MDTQLSLRRLEIFRLVVEERSVTRAAEVLMVAQPAVSNQLRALEMWLGAKLFERNGNRLVLTEAGERTDRWARDVLAGAAQIRRDVSDLATGLGGSVIIWASMAVGTYLLPKVLTDLRQARPRADLTLHIAQPGEALQAVESGDADFAVVSWDQRHLPESVEAEFLRSEPLILYMTPTAAPPSRSMPISAAMSLPLVGAPRNAVYRDLVERLRMTTHLDPNFIIRFGHVEAIKRAAIANDWALFAPAYAMQPEVDAGCLVAVDVPELVIHERLVLFSRQDHLFSPLQQAAVDAVRAVLAADMLPVDPARR
ncbi:LysR family transcriptional regulator [Nocardia sp. NPDC051929]|uniref:LysR family transcriptional regulator n=1 Tax=unclassified Nocardia TaxID=2637762 RepID=UPI003440AB0F